MKKLMVASVLLLASISHADIIKCSFTEPFINTTYSTSQSTLTYEGDVDGGDRTTVIKNVSFQIKSAGVFELVKDGQVLQTLTLNNAGSNGMSDTIYPYEVKDQNTQIGGCVSNFLKSKEPTE